MGVHDYCEPEVTKVLPEHLVLLRRAIVGWGDMDYGAPAIEPKRPYGNRDVVRDIVEMLALPDKPGHSDDSDWTEETESRCRKLHAGTEAALQIVLRAGSFGNEVLGDYYRCYHTKYDWTKGVVRWKAQKGEIYVGTQ